MVTISKFKKQIHNQKKQIDGGSFSELPLTVGDTEIKQKKVIPPQQFTNAELKKKLTRFVNLKIC